MEDEHFFLSLSAKQAKLGSGFGLIADLFFFGTFWTLLQVVFFIWPDFSHIDIKRVPYIDLRNRQVSFIHGLIGLIVGLSKLFFDGPSCAVATTPLEYIVLTQSSAYFIFDFFAMAYFNLLDVDMTIHHILAVLLFTGAISTGGGANLFLIALGVGEISNPAMHLRMMVKDLGMRYTRTYEVLEIIYFITFLFGR